MNIQAGTCVSGVKDKGLQQNSLLRLLIIFPVISAGLSVMNNICGHTLFTSSCIIFFCIFLFIFFSIFYLFIYLFIFFFFFFFFFFLYLRSSIPQFAVSLIFPYSLWSHSRTRSTLPLRAAFRKFHKTRVLLYFTSSTIKSN
jgi:hypothetical protein